MPFKSYFDAGNKADPSQYELLTLAAISGSTIKWADFEERWRRVLDKHRAPYLHTTDLISRFGVFEYGWDDCRVRDFLGDCVTLVEDCATQREGRRFVYQGLRPATVTVVLKDFQQSAQEIANNRPAEDWCAVHLTVMVMKYANYLNSDKLHFFFDQGEPFYGHVQDRMFNRKSKRSAPDWQRIKSPTELDSREVPALQAVDLLAWCVNHPQAHRHEWQKRMLGIDRDKLWLDHATLRTADQGTLDRTATYELPPRRPMR